jgi:integrase
MIKLPAEHNARERVLSDIEIATLLTSALADSNSYIWLFIKLGLATSLRHSEMLTARWEHFDPVRRRLRVKVKGGRWRLQPLTRSIAEILEHERVMAGAGAAWVFPSDRSRNGHLAGMKAAFTRTVMRAGLNPKDVIPHTLRHTAITRMATLGVDIKTLQQFSGHQTVAMVMRYTHAREQALEVALDRFDTDIETVVVELPITPKSHQAK